MRRNVGLPGGAIAPAALALSLFAAGCGGRFPEPVEHPKPPILQPPATFVRVATWTEPNWNPTSVYLTRSGILLIAEDSARVQNYGALGSRGAPQPLGIFRFNGLLKPVQVAEGNVHVFVADMGDGPALHSNLVEVARSPAP